MTDRKANKKTCTSCGLEKTSDQYHSKKGSSDGMASACRDCANVKARARWANLSVDQKRKRNASVKNKPFSEWSEEKRARARAYKAMRRLKAGMKPMVQIKAEGKGVAAKSYIAARKAFDHWVKERMTNEQSERYWKATGTPWLNPRLTDSEQYKMRYALDVEFQIKERMRRQVTKAKKRDGIASVIREAINRKGASRTVERELGYKITDLVRHLERQFTRGMSWQKFAAGEIHIDHIIPQSAFDMADDDEWRRCWCLSNLRPMWAKENLHKRDRVLTLC